MKFLNDKDYNAIKAKAEYFDTIVETVLKNSENVKTEDVTAEMIIEAIEGSTSDDNSDVLSQLNTANERVAQFKADLENANSKVAKLETQLKKANSRVTELEKEIEEIPGEQPAAISSKGEHNAEKSSVVDFANKHKGDT